MKNARIYGLTPQTFAYDWRGRRIQKQVSVNGTVTNNTAFVYDGWNPVARLNGTNSALVQSYVWGLDLSGSAQGAGGVGGLLEVSDAVNGVSFVAYDGNGNVAGLVAANGGGGSAVYEYGPFGEVIRATGPMAKANPFRFSTKYQDDERDLLYYGYRYYNASTGRWLSRDPVEEPGFTILNSDGNTGDAGPALYGFVGNDPVDDTDDLGLLDHKFEVVTGSVGPTTVFGGTGVWGQPFWCASGSASVSADDASSQVAVVNRKYPWGPGAGNACNTPAGSQTSSGTIKLLLRNCAPGKFRVDMG